MGISAIRSQHEDYARGRRLMCAKQHTRNGGQNSPSAARPTGRIAAGGAAGVGSRRRLSRSEPQRPE